MDHILAALLSFLLLYKYVAIVVIVFLAGLVLPLPSNTILLAAGAFVSQGYMNGIAVFFSALVANIIGDSLGYSLTRFWGTRIVNMKKLEHSKVFGKVNRFFRSHRGLTIFVTRFLGTPAVIVNFLAGLDRIPFRSFVGYDIVGNALDTACFLTIGYVLGSYSDNYSDIAELIAAIVLVAGLIFLIFKVFLKKTSNSNS
jgi:membrane-associated protein